MVYLYARQYHIQSLNELYSLGSLSRYGGKKHPEHMAFQLA